MFFKDGEDEVEEDHDEDEDEDDDEELDGVAFWLGASCGFHVIPSPSSKRKRNLSVLIFLPTTRISSTRNPGNPQQVPVWHFSIPMLNSSKDCNELVGYLEDWEGGRTDHPHIFGGFWGWFWHIWPSNCVNLFNLYIISPYIYIIIYIYSYIYIYILI